MTIAMGNTVIRRLGTALVCVSSLGGCGATDESETVGASSDAIVDGSVDTNFRYPFVDVVEREYIQGTQSTFGMCSGSLIGRRTVLTAGHCFTPSPNVNDSFGGHLYLPLVRAIAPATVHPEYRFSATEARPHDLAVLYLQTVAGPRPIAIHPVYFGSRVDMTFVGLGGTNYDLSPPIDFQRRFVTLPTGPDGDYLVAEHERKAIGHGDSGGALIYNNQLVGVNRSLLPPGIFNDAKSSATSVTQHMDWIIDRLFDNHDAGPVDAPAAGQMTAQEALFRDDELRSRNGSSVLRMQPDGNLVLYFEGAPVWSTQTRGQPATAATMQRDGNLVLYDDAGRALWAVNRLDSGRRSKLFVQNDGNLVLYGSNGAPYWWTGTVRPRPTGCRLMSKGQVLSLGQSLSACSGKVKLDMQSDGNLVLYVEGKGAVWSTNTAGSRAYAAVMQSDGNFVLYDRDDLPLWSTGTQGHPNAYLAVQSDGNAVLYGNASTPLWATNTVMSPPTTCGVLRANQALSLGQSLTSCNGDLRLTLLADGNLVLDALGSRVWASNTTRTGAYAAVMQSDGNLVIYAQPDDRPVWASGTATSPNATLNLQNDGNLVLYDSSRRARWWTGTVLPAPNRCRIMYRGEALSRGDSLWSCSGRLELRMQTDGNLVLYADGQVRWASNTAGTDGYVAVMQSDGNFVIYGERDNALWASGAGFPFGYLTVQNDGNVVARSAAGFPHWASNSVFPPSPVCRNLDANHALSRGQSLLSCNGRLRLTMQNDGNLVLYRNGSQVVWATNTASSNAYVAVMQADGNFVVYRDGDDLPLWNTGTTGLIAGRLDLQDDENLVVYDIENAVHWALR